MLYILDSDLYSPARRKKKDVAKIYLYMFLFSQTYYSPPYFLLKYPSSKGCETYKYFLAKSMFFA